MSENNKSTDQIPNDFASIEEAAEFWDQTTEVEIEVRAPYRHWIPLASSLSETIVQRARQEGVSIETLVNLWPAERLHVEA